MPRVFRPWPIEALAKMMAGKKAVVVYDKHLSIGAYGPMFPEVAAAGTDLEEMPKMYNVIYGLGGADATVSGFEKSFEAVVNGKAQKIHYLGVRL
jgi:pyruvate ferredoxin oxidoreductase alpha subunit